MPSLTDLIRVVQPATATPETEDIFSDSLGLIFTDDLRNQHGDPGATIVYRPSSARIRDKIENGRQEGRSGGSQTGATDNDEEADRLAVNLGVGDGEIELSVTDPKGEDERRLFAHYLWNAGILMAEMVAAASEHDTEGTADREHTRWSVQGETVLELGAEMADVTMTDYPSNPILRNLDSNVKRNIPSSLFPCVEIAAHNWGFLPTTVSTTYANSSELFSVAHASQFTLILAADCLWMPPEHRNLARSMLYFLSTSAEARILCAAGFHTGRAVLVSFFDVAIEEGLEIAEIWEEDDAGRRREWTRERGLEGIAERNRWVVGAVLRRKGGGEKATESNA
ncbi:hypothetical protein B0A49_00883 [Cryomyces minteri]|uniref:Nicotinamide N-methyltransferase n=1 Tax=Cryomyces minteri TaxID=331657 RepID=A0A4V5NI73_9PEZI|nr:hypothetical protein B0A49_00883 [Cryomyces minteri]